METQTLYQKTIKFATDKHVEQNQTIPGTNLPYVVHLSNVAMEVIVASFHSENFDLGFAVQVALLHDTLEDTNTNYEELETKFGVEIAMGVLALTKNEKLPKEERIKDCLKRIKLLQPEVWAVKLADRITNLQQPPPHWDKERKINYRDEAILILSELKDANDYLAKRLEEKIEEYERYING